MASLDQIGVGEVRKELDMWEMAVVKECALLDGVYRLGSILGSMMAWFVCGVSGSLVALMVRRYPIAAHTGLACVRGNEPTMELGRLGAICCEDIMWALKG